MKMLSLYSFLVTLLVSVSFVTDRKIPFTPRVGKCTVTYVKKWESKEKQVLRRKYKNGTLKLKLRITGSTDDKLLVITRNTADTLYLSLQHPPEMMIDTTNGNIDTTYVNVGCWCDLYMDVDLTIENLQFNPKYIVIIRYLITGDVMKEYDKNGKLGEVHNQ